MKPFAWIGLLLGMLVFVAASDAADEEPGEFYQIKRVSEQLFHQRFQATDALRQGETLEGLLCAVFYRSHVEEGVPLYGTLGVDGIFYRVYFPVENLEGLTENLADGKKLYAVVEATIQTPDEGLLGIKLNAVKTTAVDFETLTRLCADDFAKRFDVELLERYPDAASPLVSAAASGRQRETAQKQEQQSRDNWYQPDPIRLDGIALDWNPRTKTVGVYFNEQFVYHERVPCPQSW